MDIPVFRVTLSQKVKFEIEATDPQAALEAARTRAADYKFEPESYTVKELKD